MEPGSSLPHSQVPATCSYLEPTRSSPCPTYPTSWRSMLILSSLLRLGHPSVLFPSGFPTHRNPINKSPLPYTCYMSRSSREDANNQNFTFEEVKNILNLGGRGGLLPFVQNLLSFRSLSEDGRICTELCICLLDMGVKLGMSHWRRNTDRGCRGVGCRGR